MGVGGLFKSGLQEMRSEYVGLMGPQLERLTARPTRYPRGGTDLMGPRHA
jgi:hypothetical protein